MEKKAGKDLHLETSKHFCQIATMDVFVFVFFYRALTMCQAKCFTHAIGNSALKQLYHTYINIWFIG